MFKEFRDFALKGNVIDLAIGVIIGAAFGAIVSSVVDDIFMPIIGLILAGIDFSNLFIALLPQFVDPAAAFPVWVQFLILGTVVNFAFSSADFVTVMGASAVVRTMKKTQTGFALGRWLGGSMMIGLGVKLATDKG